MSREEGGGEGTPSTSDQHVRLTTQNMAASVTLRETRDGALLLELPKGAKSSLAAKSIATVLSKIFSTQWKTSRVSTPEERAETRRSAVVLSPTVPLQRCGKGPGIPSHLRITSSRGTICIQSVWF
ncbi:hypothetical protein QTP88_010550 [Uroleucon formosanum]